VQYKWQGCLLGSALQTKLTTQLIHAERSERHRFQIYLIRMSTWSSPTLKGFPIIFFLKKKKNQSHVIAPPSGIRLVPRQEFYKDKKNIPCLDWSSRLYMKSFPLSASLNIYTLLLHLNTGLSFMSKVRGFEYEFHGKRLIISFIFFHGVFLN